MAGLLSNTDHTVESTSQSYQTSSNTTNGFTQSSTSSSHQISSNTANQFTQSSTSGQQTTYTTTSSSQIHSDGIYRTSSGRETYYPDGHETRANDNRVGLRCEHHEHQETPAPVIKRSSYGLFPSTEYNVQQASGSHDAHGAGLFGSNAQEREQEVPIEKVESSSSSDSSTRQGSNGEVKPKQKGSRSSSDELHGAMLSRKNTRAEIDDEGRRELQRIFTTQSQKMGRQMSIADPNDATVDPSSDSFDLARFLKMFRKHVILSLSWAC